jgi:NADPH:quinone reductase-like Zn-dependent oxidoreductase
MVRFMSAVVVRDYGQVELGTLPVPEPGPGQIQVRIDAASINPADVVLPRGDFRDAVELPFPHVPGNDFAGTVSAVGAGVGRYRVGDPVFGHAIPRALAHMGSPSLGTGALAEYAVVEAEVPFVAHRPAELAVEQAAALPTVGLTARALLAEARPRAGETVLVVGASGGVGTTVLPLLANAHVIATARDEDAASVLGLGATSTIRYDEEYPAGVDLALNLVLPGDRLDRVAAAVRPGGRLVSITLPPPRPVPGIEVRLVLDVTGRHGGLAEVAADAVAGRLRARIAARYEFADALAALDHFAGRPKHGKLVVRVRSGP